MTSGAPEVGGGSVAGSWSESFRREASRLRAEARCLEEALDRLLVLAETMLETASQQMAEALASRDVIGQAKGVLMERRRIGPDDAFQLLKRVSQERHVRIRELAEEVAASVRGEGDGLDAELQWYENPNSQGGPEPGR